MSALSSLQELRCGHNCLVSLQVGDSPATTLPSLTELFVAGNALHTLASVSAFPALEVLDVCGNTLPFADIARHIQTLTALSDLSFEGNPLPVPQEYEYISMVLLSFVVPC
jgi:Leucine-rich repeat (LRR) protein